MLTFNHLLHAANLEPSLVQLVRHRDPNSQRAVFDAAMTEATSFDEYQAHQESEQKIAQFRAATYLAAFVAEPWSKETIFVGLWRRLGDAPGPVPPVPLSIPGTHSGVVVFETSRIQTLAEYRGRLVIEWGGNARQWVQGADKQPKRILEIRREVREPEFPGLIQFRYQLDQIEAVPSSWHNALRTARGVYLLVHRESGQQYVGSAGGADGFLGRWRNYNDGHGGNVGLKELGARADAFDVAILEVVGSAATNEELLARESSWKQKLGTKLALHRN